MSGKPKISNTWGGERSGSGRKPAYMLTENQIKATLRNVRKWAKKKGETLDDCLLKIAYGGKGISRRDQIAAIKLLKDTTMSKHTETDINVNVSQGPTIYLPEMRPDPAKMIPVKGEVIDE